MVKSLLAAALAAVIACLSLAPAAQAQANLPPTVAKPYTWCPAYLAPPGSACQVVYDNGNSSYLNVGDAMWWMANQFWGGTAYSFASWSRCQLAGCAAGPHIYYSGTTTYTRVANNRIWVRIHSHRPDTRTYCAWHADVVGSNASTTGTVTAAGCAAY